MEQNFTISGFHCHALKNKNQNRSIIRPVPNRVLPLFEMWKYVPPIGSFSCKSNLFSQESFYTRIRFKTEAQLNSKMAY